MSSPPKKMRKSGGAATAAVQYEPAQNMADEIQIDEEDPSSLYEDEEGMYLERLLFNQQNITKFKHWHFICSRWISCW